MIGMALQGTTDMWFGGAIANLCDDDYDDDDNVDIDIGWGQVSLRQKS